MQSDAQLLHCYFLLIITQWQGPRHDILCVLDAASYRLGHLSLPGSCVLCVECALSLLIISDSFPGSPRLRTIFQKGFLSILRAVLSFHDLREIIIIKPTFVATHKCSLWRPQ